MTLKGKFDTDERALIHRISAHDNFGTRDLNQWIFQNLEITRNIAVLDLGCGIGKQTIPMARVVGNSGSVVAIDISEKALRILNELAVQEMVMKQITKLCCNIDEIPSVLKKSSFDRILSSFALYYSQDPEKVITGLWNLLKSNGILFYCGPAYGNNQELRTFHYGVAKLQIPPEIGPPEFMETSSLILTRKIFSNVEVFHFENPLQFDSVESLHQYWSSYNLYDKDLENDFLLAAIHHFRSHSIFETTKRVVGVKATKD